MKKSIKDLREIIKDEKSIRTKILNWILVVILASFPLLILSIFVHFFKLPQLTFKLITFPFLILGTFLSYKCNIKRGSGLKGRRSFMLHELVFLINLCLTLCLMDETFPKINQPLLGLCVLLFFHLGGYLIKIVRKKYLKHKELIELGKSVKDWLN